MPKQIELILIFVELFGVFLLSVEAIKTENLISMAEALKASRSPISSVLHAGSTVAVSLVFVWLGALICAYLLSFLGIRWTFMSGDMVYIAMIVLMGVVVTLGMILLIGFTLSLMSGAIATFLRYVERNTRSGLIGIVGFVLVASAT